MPDSETSIIRRFSSLLFMPLEQTHNGSSNSTVFTLNNRIENFDGQAIDDEIEGGIQRCRDSDNQISSGVQSKYTKPNLWRKDNWLQYFLNVSKVCPLILAFAVSCFLSLAPFSDEHRQLSETAYCCFVVVPLCLMYLANITLTAEYTDVILKRIFPWILFTTMMPLAGIFRVNWLFFMNVLAISKQTCRAVVFGFEPVWYVQIGLCCGSCVL